MPVLSTSTTQDLADMALMSLVAYDAKIDGSSITAAQVPEASEWKYVDSSTTTSPFTPDLSPFSQMFFIGSPQDSPWKKVPRPNDIFYETDRAAGLLAWKVEQSTRTSLAMTETNFRNCDMPPLDIDTCLRTPGESENHGGFASSNTI